MLDYHPKVAGARAELLAASGKVREKRGAFDPQLTFSADSIRYNPSSNRGKEYTTVLSESTYEVLTRSGAKFFVSHRLSYGQTKSPFNSTGNTGEVMAGVKMPLLRDRGVNDKTGAEQQALVGEQIANQGVQAVLVATLRDAGYSYWDWTASVQKRAISQRLVDLATQRSLQVEQLANRGLRPKIDIAEAKSQVNSRAVSLVKADRDVQKAAFKLSDYLWDQQGNPKALAAPSQASEIETPKVALEQTQEELIKIAYDERPELKSLLLARKVLEIELDLARNQRRPDLDLVLAPGYDTGQGGIGQTWKAGLFLNFPLGWNQSEGAITTAKAKLAKIDQEEKALRLRIRNEVLDGVSAVQLAFDRLAEGKAAYEELKKVEDGERIRFEQGLSTLFLLNQRELATADAASRVVDLLAEYRIAQTQLQAATTQILQAKN